MKLLHEFGELLKKLPYNLGTAAVSSTPRRPPAQHARVYFPRDATRRPRDERTSTYNVIMQGRAY